MTIKNSLVMAGVVGLATTLGCAEKSKPGDKPAQQPPQIELGEPAAKGVPKSLPKPPPAKAEDSSETPPAPPAADAAAPGAARVGELKAALAAAADEDARVRAIDDLASLGQNALPALDEIVAAIGGDNVRVRWHAARAIGAIGEDAVTVLPKLVALLADPDPVVATQAAAAIGQIRADDGRAEIPADAAALYAAAAEGLAKAVVNPNAGVRRAALRSIARVVPQPEKLAELVDAQLADSEPAVVVAALESLADIGAPAVPFLVESLKDPKARYWAEVALTEIGPEAAPAAAALAAAAVNGEPEERLQAILALAAIGEPAAEAADELVTALESPDGAVRSAAAYALGRIRAAAADAALEKAAADADPFLAGIASWARARVHPDDKALVAKAREILVGALDGDRANAKVAAMSALVEMSGSLDDAEKGAIAKRFVGLLEDADPAIRGAAATSIAGLGASAVGALEEGLSNPQIRAVVMELLAAAGSQAHPAVEGLVAALADADPAARGDAALALAAIGPEAVSAVPALSKIVAEAAAEDPTRYAAIYALGKVGTAAAAAADALRPLVRQTDDAMLASVSAWALLKIVPEDKDHVAVAVPMLRKGLRNERENVRLEAIAALADLGEAASSAVPMLELLAEDDPLPMVREAAAAAAARLKSGK